MSKLTVVLDRKELSVSIDGGALRVNRPDGPPQRFPVKSIERVVVIGRPTVSCDVWRALAAQNIPALLLPGRGSGTAVHIGPWLASTVRIRTSQLRVASDKIWRMKVCHFLIREKILRQVQLLKEIQAQHEGIKEAIFRLERLVLRVKGMKDRSPLMGLEGAAAALYFRTIAKIMDKKWGFSGRNRRPPQDPLNSLLSLSYTMAASEVRREILIAGLDPAVGFLHANEAHKEAFTLDVLEPLRPIMDAFAIRLLTEKFTRKDFVINKQDGCRLTKRGRNIFFHEWVCHNAASPGAGSNRLRAMIRCLITKILEVINEVDSHNYHCL